MFTGDFLAHHFNESYASLTGDSSQAKLRSFIDKTLAYLVARMIEYYPQTPVFFCLGNNDSYEGDYLITRNSPFLDASAHIFDPLLKSEANRASLAAQQFPLKVLIEISDFRQSATMANHPIICQRGISERCR